MLLHRKDTKWQTRGPLAGPFAASALPSVASEATIFGEHERAESVVARLPSLDLDTPQARQRLGIRHQIISSGPGAAPGRPGSKFPPFSA